MSRSQYSPSWVTASLNWMESKDVLQRLLEYISRLGPDPVLVTLHATPEPGVQGVS